MNLSLPPGGVLVGLGCDLVEVQRIRDVLERHGDLRVGRHGGRDVEEISGDHDEVDALRLDGLDQVVDVGSLRGEEVLAVERPAEVPVGGVQDAHGLTLGERADRTAPHTPWAQPTRSAPA